MATRIPTRLGVLILVTILSGTVLIVALLAESRENESGGDYSRSVTRASTCSSESCVVRAPTEGESVVLAVSKESLNEMMSAGSDRAIALMVLNGAGFLVPQNTPVSIVDRGLGVRKVLVLEGSMIGRAGWTLSESVVDRQ
jgi:hypothetical protein